ncbi:MAG: preprotein translocase subunit SecE [Firmicutes bacterium]|nr:preprotein translocase subunit SecE [Bacillota bacterium]
MGEVETKTTAPKKDGFGKKAASFWNGVKAEYKKIIWPDRDTVVKQLVAVLVVSVITGAIIALVDFGFQNLIDFLTTFQA